MKKNILSGIRASGSLHIGNYLGSIKGMLELQDNPDYNTFYMVADVHAVTTPYNKEELSKDRRNVFIDYLAAGLDSEKSALFIQSQVPQHCELTMYLSSVITIARMQHLPTFKEKVKQYPEHSTMALLNYPILMASDILLYKCGLVPVGVDQEPHLEVAREIAGKMNAYYGMNFPEPVRFDTPGRNIGSLIGEGKMSKSVEGSYIALSDNLEIIKEKLAKVPTDSGTGTSIDDHSTLGHLLGLVEIYQGSDLRNEYEQSYKTTGLRYKELKENLASAIYNDLQPFQEKRAFLLANPNLVDDAMHLGAQKAAIVAEKTVTEVKEKMGF